MKFVNSLSITVLCFLATLGTIKYNQARLETSIVQEKVLEVQDEAGLEGIENENLLPSFDDYEEPTDAITIADENELAAVTPRALELLAKAEKYMDDHSDKFPNQNYVTAVDFTQPSSVARMFVKDMRTDVILAYHVAHGSGSDPKNTGTPTIFSNKIGSNSSSVGYFRVSETYKGKHGLSARLDGLSSTNSNVRIRGVVIHGAAYVYTSDRKTGRSWGCFAVPDSLKIDIVTMLKGGSVLYAEGKL